METKQMEMVVGSKIFFYVLTFRVKSELLVQIDGAGENEDEEGNRKAVIILGATNLPWDLDSAVVRRLDKRICTEN
jgi:SpoVK/Ycf46/Vps4 family AAA+-type ATPase